MKQLFVSSLLLIALAFLFGNSLAFKINFKPHQITTDASSTFCCLPETFSMKLMQNQAIYNTKNSSLDRFEYSAQIWADFKTGRIRTSADVNIDGKPTSVNTWVIRLPNNVIVNYEETGSKCVCSKGKGDELNPVCVQTTDSTKITKVTIEDYKGNRLIDSDGVSSTQNWVFQDDSHRDEVCWLLSSTYTLKSAVMQTHYFDMMRAIYPGVFRLHESCPPADQCVNK